MNALGKGVQEAPTSCLNSRSTPWFGLLQRALPLLDLIEIQWVDTDSLLLLLLVACAIPVSTRSRFGHRSLALSVMTRSSLKVSLEERILM
jgi:hypothetical protein